MKTPRLAVLTLLSALAAAPSLADTTPLLPILMGPAAAGQCVIGAAGCGVSAGSAMDPVGEAALVALGQTIIPSLNTGANADIAAAKKALAAPAAKSDDPGTDLAAIGGEIINPLSGGAALHAPGGLGALTPMIASRPQAVFDTHVDGSGIPTPQGTKATNLSYTQSERVEAALGGQGNAFGSDPKLSAGDAGLTPDGSGASSNGSR